MSANRPVSDVGVARRLRLPGLLALALLAACSADGGTAPEAGWSEATALTGPEDHAQGVAVDATVAVFSTGGSQVGENAVRVVPLDASAPSRALVTEPLGGIPSRALAIDDGTVYVGVGTGIAAVPLAGGPATAVVTGRPATITSVAVDGEHLFWTTSQLNVPEAAEVGRIALTGGPAQVLADPLPGRGSYTSVVADGVGGVYAASPAGVVHATPGDSPTVIDVGGAATRVALGDGVLFVVVAGEGLVSVPPTGGQVTELTSNIDDTGDVVAVAGGAAYSTRDAVHWVPADGGDPVTLASGPYPDGALAVAGDRLVFPADWRLWTVPLP